MAEVTTAAFTPYVCWHVHVWKMQQLLLESVFPGVTLGLHIVLSSTGDFGGSSPGAAFGPETRCLNYLENDLQDSDSLRSPH